MVVFMGVCAMSSPNHYTFQGDGIHVTWVPGGTGPIVDGKGRPSFFYQDRRQSLTFFGTETVTELPDLGRLVSVVLDSNDISHSKSMFSVLVPDVGVDGSTPQNFRTEGITTIESARLVVRDVFHALQTYQVEQLSGTASIEAVPLAS